MLAPDMTLTFIDGRKVSLRDAKIHRTGCRTYYIHNGNHGAGRMEMDLLERSGVNPGFCLADNLKDLLCQGADLRFQGSLIQHVHDVGVMTVDVIVMVSMGFRTVGVSVIVMAGMGFRTVSVRVIVKVSVTFMSVFVRFLMVFPVPESLLLQMS